MHMVFYSLLFVVFMVACGSSLLAVCLDIVELGTFGWGVGYVGCICLFCSVGFWVVGCFNYLLACGG